MICNGSAIDSEIIYWKIVQGKYPNDDDEDDEYDDEDDDDEYDDEYDNDGHECDNNDEYDHVMVLLLIMMLICFYIIGDNEYESPITPHHGNYNEIIVFL